MNFIPIAEPALGTQERKLVLDCLKSTWISSTGEYIEQFESEFRDYFQARYAISCSNGTTALHLALLALDIKSGDEVIVPVLTFVASANAISYTGAKPVFVDISMNTWNINISKIEEKINSRTKAIMVVHLYGYPTEMDAIRKLSKKHNLFIIEDAAEAHASTYKGRKIGTLGDIGCFSFYGNKIITTGEGGMLITNNSRLKKRAILFKNHGMSINRKYYHPVIGYNYRMTNLQAAIGLAQIRKIGSLLARRQLIAKLYRNNLKDIPGIVFQPVDKNIEPVCWLFSILITNNYGKTRNALQKYLKQNMIDSRPFFYPLTRFPMYKSREKFPVASYVSQTGINLPSSPSLSSKQITSITKAIKNYYHQ